MFREFAKILAATQPPGTPPTTPVSGADLVFQLHPADLVALLELAWDRRDEGIQDLGGPSHRSDLNRFEDTWFGGRALTPPAPRGPFPNRPQQPDINALVTNLINSDTDVPALHAIYAYMIANTRIKPIMRRVVFEYLHGEKLGAPSVATQQWLRTTEQLFFRDPPPLLVTSVRSDIRMDDEAVWRNLFQRLFNMDLNHGTDDNKPYSYVRADASNKEFVSTFEELLREVWIGIINAGNSSGVKATDDAKLLDLLRKLRDMLIARRINGNLSREEFAVVSMMSWFHMTVETDTAVVLDLKAQAASAEQRLFKIAQLVGLPAHGLSGSYFDIADSIAGLLVMIEANAFVTDPAFVVGLYTPAAGNSLERAMRTIITHWSVITGRDIKAGKVAPPDTVRRG